MSLYKFLPEIYLNSFFETGCLRLGTIYDFGDTAQHTAARGDDREGIFGIFRDDPGPIALGRGFKNPIYDEVITGPENGFAYISNISVEVTRQTENAYIFCSSRAYSDELFHLWLADDPNNDACYRINNPGKFADEIKKVLGNTVLPCQSQKIIYTEDPIHYTSPHANLDPCFTKSAALYDWQKEQRMVWDTYEENTPITPMIIHVPGAIKYCSKFRLFKDNSIIHFN